MTTTQKLLPILAAAAGMLLASRVRGDICLIREHADQLVCQMDEVQGDFRRQFRRASNYGGLRSTSATVESSARRISRLARSGRDMCGIREEAAEMLTCLRRLELEVAQARFRASAGLDPPLLGCTLHIDSKLAAACETARCIARLAGGQAAIVPGGWQTGRPTYPGTPWNGGYATVPSGNGYGVSWGGDSPIPYHGYGNGGSIPGAGNGIPTPAPGWIPGSFPPGSRGVLPPGTSGGYEEIGPPLSVQPGGRRPGVVPGMQTGQPGGIYGPRGNGVELNGNSAVLRIGGLAVQLR